MLCSSECFLAFFSQNPISFSRLKLPNRKCVRKPVSKIECQILQRNHRSRYGGIIPAILESLETVENLDEAFEPWKRLNHKERTVILKEQTDWRRAVEIFHWFKNHGSPGVNLIHYNVVLWMVSKAKNLNVLINLWCEMHNLGIIPDNLSYSALIEVCLNLGANKAMLLWVGDMFKRGVSPDEMTMVSILKAYKATGKFSRSKLPNRKCRWKPLSKIECQILQRNRRLRYGRFMAAILESLETVENLDKAFEPWKKLKHKERTIILKEQTDWRRALEIFDWFKTDGSHGVNLIHYNVMLKMASKAQNLDLLINLWCEMHDSGITPDYISYSALIEAYLNLGANKEMLLWVGDMYKRGVSPDEMTMVSILKSYKATGKFSRSKLPNGKRVRKPVSKIECQILQRNHCSRYSGFIPAILESLETVENLDKAFEPWKRLNHRERTIILKEQTDWRRAVEIFDWFKTHGSHGVNLIHYNVILRMVSKAQNLDLLLNLWCEMHNLGIIPDNSSYSALIEAYLNLGGNKAMLLWVGDMYKRGVSPDEMTMVSILKAYKATGEFREGERLFNRWVTSRKNMPQTGKGCSLYSHNVMVDAYAKAGQFEKALGVFLRMIREGPEPDAVTFNTIAHACGQSGRFKEVPKFVTAIIKLNFIPDSKSHVSILSLCIKAGYIDLAESYFSTVKGKSVILDILGYRKLLYGYTKLNMVNKAETLVREIEAKGVVIDEYAQSALTRMYINAGLLRKAWSWFEKISDSISADCFSANIDAFGEGGFLSLAERAFLRCLEKKKAGVSTFNVMVKAYGIGKEYEMACELVDCMEEKYGVLPDSCTYNSLVIVLSGAQLLEKACIYARKMYDAGLVSSCFSYSIIIGCFVKLGDVEMAENLFNEMSRLNMQIDMVTYSMLIDAYASIGNVEMASKYLDLLRKAGFKVNLVICNSLLKLYTKAGCLLEAAETYSLLKSLRGTGTADLYASNCMISMYCDNSMVKEAEDIFEELRLSKSANEFSYTTLLLQYKRLGRYKEAFRISREMQSLGYPNEPFGYNAVIGLYASVGRAKGAVRIFRHMLKCNVPPNDTTFRMLRCVLADCGVAKKDIRRLEKVTRRNYETGVREWVKVINSIVGLDDYILEHSINLTGSMKKDSVVETVEKVIDCEKAVVVSRDLLYV
ncbi:pentatricopeptide repeat-containing protein At3g23020-like [Carex rostrata]